MECNLARNRSDDDGRGRATKSGNPCAIRPPRTVWQIQSLRCSVRCNVPLAPIIQALQFLARFLRLGKLCGNGPDLWLNLQKRYDLQRAEKELREKIKAIPTLQWHEVFSPSVILSSTGVLCQGETLGSGGSGCAGQTIGHYRNIGFAKIVAFEQ